MARLYRMGCRTLLLCIAAALSIASAAAAGQLPLITDPDEPPGRLVDLGGYRLHIYCVGPESAPSVLFDAGLGGFSMDWWFVMGALAGDTRACAYDRAGYGWSDMGPAPRATDQIATELEMLLDLAGVAPPYVLVGHSFGGYNVHYFAAMHPKSVSGIVLVDSSHPEQLERLPALPVQEEQLHRGTLVTSFDPRAIYTHYPEAMWFAMGALMSSRMAMATQRREFLNFAVSAAQVREVGPLPEVPLVVLTRGRRVWPETPMGDSLEKAWQDMQADLAAAVPGARQVRALHSGHLVHLDQPELVAAAVREVIRAACGRRGGACTVTTP